LIRFGEFLDSLTTPSPQGYPEEILIDTATSDIVEPKIEIEKKIFANRLEAGKYLNECFSPASIAGIDNQRGLWAWLALFFFDELCPPDAQGRRKPGERARWVPAVGDFRKYYRHLLAGPYRIYRAHRDKPERAMALLCTPLHQPGDIVEQLASRQELVTNIAVMEVATALYIDSPSGQPKRGAAGRGPGSARRLADIFNQFDVTWDLYAMTSDDLLNMLPREFSRFRPKEA
jgi:hypothetical protein